MIDDTFEELALALMRARHSIALERLENKREVIRLTRELELAQWCIRSLERSTKVTLDKNTDAVIKHLDEHAETIIAHAIEERDTDVIDHVIETNTAAGKVSVSLCWPERHEMTVLIWTVCTSNGQHFRAEGDMPLSVSLEGRARSLWRMIRHDVRSSLDGAHVLTAITHKREDEA